MVIHSIPIHFQDLSILDMAGYTSGTNMEKENTWKDDRTPIIGVRKIRERSEILLGQKAVFVMVDIDGLYFVVRWRSVCMSLAKPESKHCFSFRPVEGPLAT